MAVAQERDPPAGAARSANVEGELLIPINSYQINIHILIMVIFQMNHGINIHLYESINSY